MTQPPANSHRCSRCGADLGPPIESWPHTCGCGLRRYHPEDPGLCLNDAPPSIWTKGANYVQSWLRWTQAGRPVRDEETVEQLRAICRPCDHYDNGTCKRCGCGVAKGSWLGDKLKWATESCPEGEW